MVDAMNVNDDISQASHSLARSHLHQRGERDPHGQGPKDQGHIPRQTAKNLNPLPHARDDSDEGGLQDLGHGHTDGDCSPPSSPNNSQPDRPVELGIWRPHQRGRDGDTAR